MLGAGGGRPLLSWPLRDRAVGGSSCPHVTRQYVCVQERVSAWVCALDSAVTGSRDPSLCPALLLRLRPLEVWEGQRGGQAWGPVWSPGASSPGGHQELPLQSSPGLACPPGLWVRPLTTLSKAPPFPTLDVVNWGSSVLTCPAPSQCLIFD